MKESHSVEARRRRALPYYNVKRRRQKEREREAERSRRRREEQQDADQRRRSARVRQQQRRAITPAVTGSGRVYLGPMTTVCHHWKHHHRSAVGGALSWDHCHWRVVATVWRVLASCIIVALLYFHILLHNVHM